jgi:phosphonate transport system substrate-binding protein
VATPGFGPRSGWRWLLLATAWFSAAPAWSAPATNTDPAPIRLGVTPVFLDNQVALLNRWRNYLERQTGRQVTISQRQTYKEIVDLLNEQQLDAAWICGFPYVVNRARMELLATPVYAGAPLYRSYLIVAADDREVHGYQDLRGKVFAYSDPDSNSGYLVPQVELDRLGYRDDTYFNRHFFTWSHRNVVQAIARGLADAGAVDGYVWESLRKFEPELAEKTRIAYRSAEYGFPPIVASIDTPEAIKTSLRQALISMPDTPAGRSLLEELNLDGFMHTGFDLYQGILDNLRKIEAHAP